MISLTRLSGSEFALNPDFIERAEAHPDTTITMVDGSGYVVQETLVELGDRIRDYRASVLAAAHLIVNRDTAGEGQ